MNDLRIVRIEVHNILGIADLDIEPGALCVVEGGNAQGKTSFLESLRLVATEGHDPWVLREGATEGFVRVTLSDGAVFQKTVTPKGSKFDATHPLGGKVSRARAYVESLIDDLGTDPLALVFCPDLKRAEYLRDILRVDVSKDELRQAAGEGAAFVASAKGLTGMDAIDAVRQAVYDERTHANKTAKEKASLARQLGETLPPTPESVPSVEEAKATLRGLEETARAAEKASAAVYQQRLKEIEDRKREAERKLEEEIREALRVLAEERAADTKVTKDAWAGKLAEASAALATAESLTNQQERAAAARRLVETAAAESKEASVKAESLGAALARLDALRAAKLATLPVKGLEIRGRGVFLDGHPFSRANTARQFEVSFEVALLRAKQLPLLVIDHGEALDEGSWALLRQLATKLNRNVFVARRTEGPLAILPNGGEYVGLERSVPANYSAPEPVDEFAHTLDFLGGPVEAEAPNDDF